MPAAIDLAPFVPVQHWRCPSCPTVARTRESRPHGQFHSCPALGGLTAPLVPADQRVDVRVHEREDYVGGEDVQYVNGRPVMAIEVVRDDGNDVAVYAPTAHGGGRA